MNDKFDELAKGLAQSVTRRQALRRFSVGIASAALAALGLANKVQADPKKLPYGSPCQGNGWCEKGLICCKQSKLCQPPWECSSI